MRQFTAIGPEKGNIPPPVFAPKLTLAPTIGHPILSGTRAVVDTAPFMKRLMNVRVGNHKAKLVLLAAGVYVNPWEGGDAGVTTASNRSIWELAEITRRHFYEAWAYLKARGLIVVRRRGPGNSEVTVCTNPLRLVDSLKFPPGGTSRSSPRGALLKDQYKGKIRSDEDQDGIGDHARESGSGSPSARLSNRERALIQQRTAGLDYAGRIVGRCECGGLTRAHGAGAVLCDACRRVYTDGQTSQNGTFQGSDA